MMDSPNSLVMRIIILFWMEDKKNSNVLIGYKKFHPNHHWKMESSSKFIGSWKEMKPLIGRKDFVTTLILGSQSKQGHGKVWAGSAT